MGERSDFTSDWGIFPEELIRGSLENPSAEVLNLCRRIRELTPSQYSYEDILKGVSALYSHSVTCEESREELAQALTEDRISFGYLMELAFQTGFDEQKARMTRRCSNPIPRCIYNSENTIDSLWCVSSGTQTHGHTVEYFRTKPEAAFRAEEIQKQKIPVMVYEVKLAYRNI